MPPKKSAKTDQNQVSSTSSAIPGVSNNRRNTRKETTKENHGQQSGKKTTATTKQVTVNLDHNDNDVKNINVNPTANRIENRENKKRPRTEISQEPIRKRLKLSQDLFSYLKNAHGNVLSVGDGEVGQLGLGPDILEKYLPAPIKLDETVVQVCAGGMHSVCLTKSGKVYTFGCNDDAALGRATADEDDNMIPGNVELPEKIAQVSAGDGHTAAVSENGSVFIWGTFRDNNGIIGINPINEKLEQPVQIMKKHKCIKVASGCDHLTILTDTGDIYTLGASELGQLGRVAEYFCVRGGRRGLSYTLTPMIVCFKRRDLKFVNIWAGGYSTFAKSDEGIIYAWGLNNYYQLGFADMQNKFTPEKSTSFVSEKDWQEISCGQHHTIARDINGKVYCLGRKEYGRLGLGESTDEKKEPTLVPKLATETCINATCGNTVSYAVTKKGLFFAWGMGSTKQLAQGLDLEEDAFVPELMKGKRLEQTNGIMVAAGGTHTLLLIA